MTERPTDYADRVLEEAMTAATGGLDPAAAERALTSAIRAVEKQMQALEAKDYQALTPEQIARSVSHTAKAGDVIFRLMEFASGRADSRPDKGTDWLRALSDKQLAVVMGFIEENEGRAPDPREQKGTV
jgi:hypothetical protein